MNKQLRQMLVIAVVVAMVIVSGTPYLSSAEESTTEEQPAEEASTETEAAAAEQPSEPIATESAQVEQPKKELTPITATKSVASNDLLELFIDEKTANVRIVDKRSGKEWLGAPQVDKKMPPNNKTFIDAPVHIRFTEGVSTTQTFPLKEKETKTTFKPIENGIRIEYDLVSIKMSFATEYRLTDNGLEVNVPFDSIKEAGLARLTSLEIFPFFGAADAQAEGAIFVPDGSGALIRFKEKHPTYFDNYSQFIYGGDYAFNKKVHEQVLRYFKRDFNVREFAALPVFGIYKKDTGFLAIVTNGDYDAKINATPSGLRNIDLYRASPEFIYRNDDVIFIGNSGEIPLFQGNIIKGDRTVRYILLEDEKANYVGMAHAYRDYLINEEGIKPIKQEKVPFQLRLFGGVLRDEVIGSTYVAMTTFEQAKIIIDEFIAKGIDSIEVIYDGWSDDGKYGNHPEHFPVDKHLGGSKELKDLAAYAKEKGIRLYLKANYVRPFESSDNIRPSKDAIRGISRDVMPIFNYWVSDRYTKFREMFYLLKPERVFNKYIVDEADEFAELGVAGVHLDNMGNMLYSDQDPRKLTDRKLTAETWIKSIDLMREKVGKASVDYGFGYTLGHVDRIDNIPLDSSHYTFEDAAVPFYQIAIHGLIPYTTKPSNLRDDPRTEFLRAIEYGAMPTYELTFEETKKFQRTMVNTLFSSHYKYWLEPSVEEYSKVAEIYNKLIDQTIVNHEQLDTRLFRTTYENGLQVIVNYDSKVASAGDHLVKAYDYVVVEGGE